MKTQLLIVSVIIWTILFTLTDHRYAHGEMTDEQYYEQYLTQYIEKCAQKDKQFSGSCMITINRYGALNCLKAAYVAYFKEILVSQLLYDKVERKPHKIDHIINQSFFKVYRASAEELKDQYNEAHNLSQE